MPRRKGAETQKERAGEVETRFRGPKAAYWRRMGPTSAPPRAAETTLDKFINFKYRNTTV
jgi:hypothetical protein